MKTPTEYNTHVHTGSQSMFIKWYSTIIQNEVPVHLLQSDR